MIPVGVVFSFLYTVVIRSAGVVRVLPVLLSVDRDLVGEQSAPD